MAQIITGKPIVIPTVNGNVNTTGSFKDGTTRQACSPTGGGVVSGIDPETGKTKTINADILQDGTRNIVTNLGDGRQVRNSFDKCGTQLTGIRVNADGTSVDLMGNNVNRINQNITAGNADGDTLTLTQKPKCGCPSDAGGSTVNGQTVPETQNIYGKFSLSMDKVKNLFSLSDGVVPGKEYNNFPQRLGSKEVQWNAGATENLKDSNPKVSPTGSYDRSGNRDNVIDSNEASLMSQQMSYAAELQPQAGMVAPKTAISARNFLQSLYNGSSFGPEQGKISSGLDVDGDGCFTYADAQALEMNDGAKGLTNRDFDIATSRYVSTASY